MKLAEIKKKHGIILIEHKDYIKIMELGFRFEIRNKIIRNKFYKTALISKGDPPKRERYTLARFLLNISDPKIFADHKDRNPLNNVRSNLREANKNQNEQNKPKPLRKNTTSKYKGVCWIKSEEKWKSYIGVNGKLMNLARHSSEIEAAKSYDNAAIKFHGEFAKTNFPVPKRNR